MDYLPAERMYRNERARTWDEIDGGFELREEWYDVPTSTYRTTIRHIFMDGTIVEPADETGYHANEVIRCYTATEIEQAAGLDVSHHLTRRHLDDPNHKPGPGEPRGMIVLKRPDG